MATQPDKKLPLIGFLTHSLIGDYHISLLLRIQDQARELGFSLVIFTPFFFFPQKHHGSEYLRTFDLIDPELYDGFLISGGSMHTLFAEQDLARLSAKLSNKPVVAISEGIGDEFVVRSDGYHGFYHLTKHLITEHGFSRFAYVGGPKGNADADTRRSAFLACLKDCNISFNPAHEFEGDYGFRSGTAAVDAYFSTTQRKPQAFVCANDDMALGVMESLKKRSIAIPDDVAVVGYDDIYGAQISQPGLTTVNQSVSQQVDHALQILLAMIAGEKPKPHNSGASRVFELEPHLVIRSSCSCRSPQAFFTSAIERDQKLQQRTKETLFEKGYNIGLVTTFSKNIMEELSIESLKHELLTLCSALNLGDLSIYLYPGILEKSQSIPFLPQNSERFFCYTSPATSGSDPAAGSASIPTTNLGLDFERLRSAPTTVMVSELLLKNLHFGFITLSIDQPEAVIGHMINLELSSFFRNLQLKTEMERALNRLKHLDALKNEFMANIAHDFRSPLTVTTGVSELGMAETPADSDHYQRYKVVLEASLRMKDTIDRFLELTRLDSEDVAVQASQHNLSTYLSHLCAYYASSISGTGISIQFESESPTDLILCTDIEKVDQILNNLISNAIKFVDPQTGRITVRLCPDEADGALIRVEDNGIGIPPEKVDIVFERFVQLPETSAAIRRKGSGIGLSFSRRLSSILGGELSAYSAGLGHGSIFTLRLRNLPNQAPASTTSPAGPTGSNASGLTTASDATRKAASQSTSGDGTPGAGVLLAAGSEAGADYKNATIVLIEDEPEIAQLEVDILKRDGYSNIFVAADGKKGLELIYQKKPDLIICDLNLPLLRGDQVYAELLSNHDFSMVPFVFVSAVSDKNLIVDLKKRGVEVFLTKPINLDEFKVSIGQQLKNLYALRQLEQLSQIDRLTGLSNKHAVLEQIQTRFNNRKFIDFSFLFLDLDHFKTINDTYGHGIGDIVLSRFGSMIREHIRPYDIAGRFGGEEFLVVIPNAHLQEAISVATKLLQLTETMVFSSPLGDFSIHVSIGISNLIYHRSLIEPVLNGQDLKEVFEPETRDGTEWLMRSNILKDIKTKMIDIADSGLYLAKQEGRNCVRYLQV